MQLSHVIYWIKNLLDTFSMIFFVMSQDIAEERAEKVFQQLDVNEDGELNEEEFVSGALKVFSSTAKIWTF